MAIILESNCPGSNKPGGGEQSSMGQLSGANYPVGQFSSGAIVLELYEVS